MANVNIFDQYGIKEVANVYFEALADDTKNGVYKGDIVLFLDSLKVSTIETTAENTAAQGGWGNPKLIQWDYGKEINITLEDALISFESLRFMMGGAIHRPSSEEPVWVRHTEEVICDVGGKVPVPKDHLTNKKFDGIEAPAVKAETGHPIRLINLTTGARTQLVTDGATIDGQRAINFVNPSMIGENGVPTAEGDRIRIFWEEKVESATTGNETAIEVTISPDTFPGTYRVVGDTLIRSQATGADEAFQFVIEKAKVQSNVTITLQAEGDPSTFEMTLNVLRDTSHGNAEMMKLVRYAIESNTTSGEGNDYGSIIGS